MEMLLLGACLAMLGLAVSCLAFNAALPRDKDVRETQPEMAAAAVTAAAAAPARFFADPVIVPLAAHAKAPIEALLLQIENHVRLEHAAAESFLAAPDRTLLHSRTMSQLLN